MEGGPPFAGAAGQQHEADGPGVRLGPAADAFGQAFDFGLLAFGVVDHDEHAGLGAALDELFEGLPALAEGACDGAIWRVEEARRPAVLTQGGGEFDEQARLAESARAVDQAAGIGAGAGCAPIEQVVADVADVHVADGTVARLEEFAWANLLQVLAERALLGVEEAVGRAGGSRAREGGMRVGMGTPAMTWAILLRMPAWSFKLRRCGGC